MKRRDFIKVAGVAGIGVAVARFWRGFGVVAKKPRPSPSPSPSPSPVPSPSPEPSPEPSPSPSPEPSPSPSPEPSPIPSGHFLPTSFWNKPLPTTGVPVDSESPAFVDWLRTNAPSIHLAGLGTSLWGCPVVYSQPTDPLWQLTLTNNWPENDIARQNGIRMSDEMANVIGLNNDAPVYVIDDSTGYELALFETTVDVSTHTIHATSAPIYWLDSNGLDLGDTNPDGDPRNRGHRGLPGYTYQVLRSDVDKTNAGHVLKVAIPGTGEWHVRPMTGHEAPRAGIIGEGMRLRIKESQSLTGLGLSPQALSIARTLKRYGAIIGDNGGGNIELKMEQNRGQWTDTGLTGNSLAPITPDMLEFVQRGYEP